MNFGAIFRKILTGGAAVGATAAAAAVAVIAASFALYALLKDYIGPAGASAVVALVFALIAAGGAVFAAMAAAGPKPKKPKRGELSDESPIDKFIELARERPLIAAGAAVVAGVLALRNPLVVTTLMSTLMRPPKPRA